jgi:hypothetical protein
VVVNNTFSIRQSRSTPLWRGSFGMINTWNVTLNTQWTWSFQQCLLWFVCWWDLFLFTGQQKILWGDRVMQDVYLPIARRRPWYRISLHIEALPDLLQGYTGKPLVITIPVTTISVITTALIILLWWVLIALIGSIIFWFFYKRSRLRHERKSVIKKRSYKSASKK